MITKRGEFELSTIGGSLMFRYHNTDLFYISGYFPGEYDFKHICGKDSENILDLDVNYRLKIIGADDIGVS